MLALETRMGRGPFLQVERAFREREIEIEIEIKIERDRETERDREREREERDSFYKWSLSSLLVLIGLPGS